MSITRRSLAWINLAYHFNKHIFVRLPVRMLRRGDDVQLFRDGVEPEGYIPLLAAERALLPRAMQCVNCGLCAIAATAPEPVSAWDEPWTFVVGPARSIDRAATVAAALPAAAFSEDARAICPMDVPIPELATMLERIGGSARNAINEPETAS